MLTRGDDYPIHQTAEPIAYAGTDRNFYDRYFFNGYPWDGSAFLGVALGVYPHLNVMDAAFAVTLEGVQHNLHASRVLGMERMDTQVGPIAVEVLEPLRRLRVRVRDDDRGMRADLVFSGRTAPIEEPRFTYRTGPRTILDYTRLTQNGEWQGWIEVAGRRIGIAPGSWVGTRDRSWGVRPVGQPDSQPVAPPPPPQFFWVWAPVNYPETASFFHDNADATGRSWNRRGVLASVRDGETREVPAARAELTFRSGTRRVDRATLVYEGHDGLLARVELEPRTHFYMSGIGYMSRDWGHGHYKGELAVGSDTYDLSTIQDGDPAQMHIQALCRARLEVPGQPDQEGMGVLEQLFVGPHAPSGFREIFDPAP